jgi:hypothetical protein
MCDLYYERLDYISSNHRIDCLMGKDLERNSYDLIDELP